MPVPSVQSGSLLIAWVPVLCMQLLGSLAPHKWRKPQRLLPQDLLLYQLPHHAHFYAELVNSLQGRDGSAEHATVTVRLTTLHFLGAVDSHAEVWWRPFWERKDVACRTNMQDTQVSCHAFFHPHVCELHCDSRSECSPAHACSSDLYLRMHRLQVLYSKCDALRLEPVVGTLRTRKMLKGGGSTFLFC